MVRPPRSQEKKNSEGDGSENKSLIYHLYWYKNRKLLHSSYYFYQYFGFIKFNSLSYLLNFRIYKVQFVISPLLLHQEYALQLEEDISFLSAEAI